jgi:hypothetical protein
MPSAEKIRMLNDQFRSQLRGGRVVMTAGIVGRPDARQILARVVYFRDFSPENDPHGEHDFGAFDQAGAKIFWKIDYYARDLQGGSEDPADPEATTRVLTIMLAEEY